MHSSTQSSMDPTPTAPGLPTVPLPAPTCTQGCPEGFGALRTPASHTRSQTHSPCRWRGEKLHRGAPVPSSSSRRAESPQPAQLAPPAAAQWGLSIGSTLPAHHCPALCQRMHAPVGARAGSLLTLSKGDSLSSNAARVFSTSKIEGLVI